MRLLLYSSIVVSLRRRQSGHIFGISGVWQRRIIVYWRSHFKRLTLLKTVCTHRTHIPKIPVVQSIFWSVVYIYINHQNRPRCRDRLRQRQRRYARRKSRIEARKCDRQGGACSSQPWPNSCSPRIALHWHRSRLQKDAGLGPPCRISEG